MSSERNRYFIRLSYIGTNYHGWQIQPGSISVQEVLQEALGKLLGNNISVIGAGRTDTGVHARCFYAHFDTLHSAEEIKKKQICYKMNRMLPTDISINEVWAVKENAHARFDAFSRTYHYYICTRKDPYKAETAWLYERKLDVNAMQTSAKILFKHTNFASFSRSNTQVKTFDCTIMKAEWHQEERIITFEIEANRFLRNMVRALVGTMVDVGLGKLTPEAFERIILSQDRRNAGYSAPARGLHLHEIEYPNAIFLERLC